MEHSESIAALAAALSSAQGEVENAAKNANNPHFKSKYADLAEILNTVKPVLSKHGLAVIQIPGFSNGVVTVDTMLTHKSGEWIKGTSGAPAQKQDPQGVGSAVTYLRRYSLAALCGIAQEDDDGEGAIDRRPAQQAAQKAATDKQVQLIRRLMGSHVITDTERARVESRIEKGLSLEGAAEAIDWLNQTIPARKSAEKEERQAAGVV